MPDIKRMSVKEFRELGLLQEVNRRVLHPCGLALEVIVDKETGEESFGGVWDYRDDPEGLIYRDKDLDLDKAASVMDLIGAKEFVRLERFGYVIQPAVATKEKSR
jgi:hypothetical protein